MKDQVVRELTITDKIHVAGPIVITQPQRYDYWMVVHDTYTTGIVAIMFDQNGTPECFDWLGGNNEEEHQELAQKAFDQIVGEFYEK